MTRKKVILNKEPSRYVICLFVENKPNVLARISSLMGRRNFNINAITAAETHMPGITRITLAVTSDDENVLNQIVTQTEKLEEVRSAHVLDPANTVYRELLLIKIKADETERTAIREITDIYRGKIIDLSTDSMIIELTGAPGKIDGFCRMVEQYDVKELSRTGVTGMERGLYDIDD